MILDGRLVAEQRLPPTRDLSATLQVSRNTVAAAYDLLAAEGYVVGRPGSGTFVADFVPAPDPEAARRPTEPGPTPREMWRVLHGPAGVSGEPARYDFRPGMPDPRLFPYQAWRRMVTEELRATSVGIGAYGDPAGDAGLRRALARHVGAARAIPTGPERIIVTNGLQQVLDLVARVFLAAGDVVAVEDPGYRPPRAVFRAVQASVVGVPVDREGLQVEALPDGARLVYVTPAHQYPLGVSMSLRRRLELLAWARARDALIVEDDYDSEFRYAGRQIEPLRALDAHDRVVYAGSLSKVMLPSLRLGFCVAPESLYEAMRAAKFITDWHTALTMQRALARFIDAGMLARHVRRVRRIYEQRHHLISHLLHRDLGRWLEVIPSAAGLHVTALLRSGSADDADALADAARGAGVDVETLRPACLNGPVAGLIFGYGLIPVEDIPAALSALRSSWSSTS